MSLYFSGNKPVSALQRALQRSALANAFKLPACPLSQQPSRSVSASALALDPAAASQHLSAALLRRLSALHKASSAPFAAGSGSGFVAPATTSFSAHTSSNSSQSSTAEPTAKPWWQSRWMHLALQVATGALTIAAFTELTGAKSNVLLEAQACGIVAFTSKDTAAVDFLLEGLTILQNRGYDSAGVATVAPAAPKDPNNPDAAPATGGSIVITKHASSVSSTSDSIELLKANAPARHVGHTCGIAHTRWATHGGRTDANAHPFIDYKHRLALVHNGTIENCGELRAELLAKGVTFTSQTDSEVIVNLISVLLDTGLTVEGAVKAALARLEGTWGLVVIHKDAPQQLIAARNGSPLVVGISDQGMFVASEVTAFMRHTSQFIPLADGELCTVGPDATSLSLSRVQQAHTEVIESSPAPYPHWTIKEIFEQPAALLRTIGFGSRVTQDGFVKLGGLERSLDSLLHVQDLLIAACGTSLFAASYGAKIMRSLGSFATVQLEDAAEVVPDSLPTARKHSNGSRTGGICVVSQSGETKDTHRALVLGMENDLPAFSVVNQVGSLIARTTGCGVYLNAGREHAVASTKAFSTQVTAMAMIAVWFSQARALQEAQQLARYKAKAHASATAHNNNCSSNTSHTSHANAPSSPPAANAAAGRARPTSASAGGRNNSANHAHNNNSGDNDDDGCEIATIVPTAKQRELVASLHSLSFHFTTALKTHEQMKTLAQKLTGAKSMFLLGKGFGEAIAKESALKIKEITYIHAEGFSGGALKHGPFALLDEGTPVVLFAFNDCHFELMRVAAQEVKARGTFNIVVTDRPDAFGKDTADEIVVVPSNGMLTALTAVVPMQLLAYEVAVAKGINPDKPKNLAKAVTVD